MDTPTGRRSITVYLVSFVIIGVCLSLLGPSIDHLKSQVGTTDGGMGLVFVGQSVGYILGSFIGGAAVDRGHGHRAWSIAMGVMVVAILAISVAGDLVAVVCAFGVLGMACSVGDVAGNALVVWSRPDDAPRALNLLHLSFAIGALGSPIVVNRAIRWTDELWPIAVVVCAASAVCVYRLLVVSAPRRPARRLVEHDVGGARSLTWPLATVAVFFVVYVSLESGAAGWFREYTSQIGYGNDNTADSVQVVFWCGFVLGRVLAIVFSRLLSVGRILVISVGLTVVATVVFVAVPGGGPSLYAIGFTVALAGAPQFAAMVAYVEHHMSLTGAATSVIVASAGVGASVLPWVIGQLFDRRGPEVFPPVLALTAVGLVAATALVGAVVGRRRQGVAIVHP